MDLNRSFFCRKTGVSAFEADTPVRLKIKLLIGTAAIAVVIAVVSAVAAAIDSTIAAERVNAAWLREKLLRREVDPVKYIAGSFRRCNLTRTILARYAIIIRRYDKRNRT